MKQSASFVRSSSRAVRKLYFSIAKHLELILGLRVDILSSACFNSLLLLYGKFISIKEILFFVPPCDVLLGTAQASYLKVHIKVSLQTRFFVRKKKFSRKLFAKYLKRMKKSDRPR